MARPVLPSSSSFRSLSLSLTRLVQHALLPTHRVHFLFLFLLVLHFVVFFLLLLLLPTLFTALKASSSSPFPCALSLFSRLTCTASPQTPPLRATAASNRRRRVQAPPPPLPLLPLLLLPPPPLNPAAPPSTPPPLRGPTTTPFL